MQAIDYGVLPSHLRALIIRVEAGSTLHGISLPTSDDDRDELAVAVEPADHVTGLSTGKESYMYRTAPEGERSHAGDLDLTVHGLRKFAHLACNGNPTIIQTFFVPSDRRACSALGNELLAIGDAFLSRQCASRYAGYLRGQRDRFEGRGRWTRGAREGSRDPERMWKYAAHMIRLGMQGTELLSTGWIHLPMRDANRDWLRDVRAGNIPGEVIAGQAKVWERNLREYEDPRMSSPLADAPDYPRVNALLHRIYTETWDGNRNASE